MNKRWTDDRGHKWKLVNERPDWDNSSTHPIDMFGYDWGNHNGPSCTLCGYEFCVHCYYGPQESCAGPEED